VSAPTEAAPLRVAAIQAPLGGSREENVERVTAHVRAAAAKGAQVILPPELFEGPYFCREEREAFFAWARPAEENPTIEHFARLAKELGVVVPISFFERAGQAHYNSVAVADADGRVLGV
jgi:N-carbamoylputrescine amidase